MTTDHDNDQTPADRPVEGARAAEAPARAATTPEEPKPTDASLPTILAMHERVIGLRHRVDHVEELIGDLIARLDASHAHVLAVGSELAPAIVDLRGIVNEHADVLEDVIGRVEALTVGAQPRPRGEVSRRLPGGAGGAGSTAGAPTAVVPLLEEVAAVSSRPPLFPGVTTPRTLAPGETNEKTFHLDPRNPSSLVHQLDNGGEVEFRIQSPRGGGITRDGRSGRGGTRRG